ncbi:MAG: hypothetical protein NTW87_33790, partial [Planctomycetota bacterium]|nr:hypothetical protein [Planctomycetota bacterium]
MPTILFAWELGAGFGHLAPYRTLTETLNAAGHRVIFAVRDVPRADQVFRPGTVTCIQAPVNNYRLREVVPEPATYAHVLKNFGYDDPVTLAGMASGWRYLLDSVKPDLVILDHSPTALLAMRGTPLRRMLVGHGFFCPPDVYPSPSLRPWLNLSHDALRADEDRVLASTNAVLQRQGGAPLHSIGQLFAEVDESILTTVPELDHYPQRQGGNYWGLIANYPGDAPEWPAVDGRKVFCYLKQFGHLPALLKAVRDLGLPAVVCPDRIPEAIEKEFAGPALRFEHRLLDLSRVCADACCAVLHGGNVLLQFLLAGKPVLLFPVTLENYIPCAAVQRLGAGVMVDRDDPSQFAPKLAELLNNERYTKAAQEFAARYAHLDLSQQGEKLARRIEELVAKPVAPDRFRHATGGDA